MEGGTNAVSLKAKAAIQSYLSISREDTSQSKLPLDYFATTADILTQIMHRSDAHDHDGDEYSHESSSQHQQQTQSDMGESDFHSSDASGGFYGWDSAQPRISSGQGTGEPSSAEGGRQQQSQQSQQHAWSTQPQSQSSQQQSSHQQQQHGHPPQSYPQQQQQQRHPSPSPHAPLTQSHTSSASQSHSHSRSHDHSPTPFRPMPPREYSLGSNAKRDHPAMLASLPFRGSMTSMTGSRDSSYSVVSGASAGASAEEQLFELQRQHFHQHQQQLQQLQRQSDVGGGGGGLANTTIGISAFPQHPLGTGEIIIKTKGGIGEGNVEVADKNKKHAERRISKISEEGGSALSLTSHVSPPSVVAAAAAAASSSASSSPDKDIDKIPSLYESGKSVFSEDVEFHETGERSSQRSEQLKDRLDVPKSDQVGNVVVGADNSNNINNDNNLDESDKTETTANSRPLFHPPGRKGTTPMKTPTRYSDPYERRALEVNIGEADRIPVPQNVGSTPMSVSTLSPTERMGASGARKYGGTMGHASAEEGGTDPTAASRFGRLLQECRVLTEGCGDSTVTSNVDTSVRDGSNDDGTKNTNNSSRGDISGSDGGGLKQPPSLPLSGLAHKSSSMPDLSSDRMNFGEKNFMLMPKLQLRQKAAAAGAANSDIHPITMNQEIDTRGGREYNMSALTMDPTLRESAVKFSRRKSMGGTTEKSYISDLSVGVDQMYDDETGNDDLEEYDNVMEKFFKGQKREIVDDETASLDPKKMKKDALALEIASALGGSSGYDPIHAKKRDFIPEKSVPTKMGDAGPKKYSWLSHTEDRGENEVRREASDKDITTSNQPPGKIETYTVPMKGDSDVNDARPSLLGKLALQGKATLATLTGAAVQVETDRRSMSSYHTSDFDSVGSGGLLVGFGTREELSSSGSDSGSSDGSSSDDSSGSSSDGSSSGSSDSDSDDSESDSDESSSSSSGSDYSDETSSGMPTVARNGINFDNSDDVSQLSFGGASALAAQAAVNFRMQQQKPLQKEGVSPGESTNTSSSPENKESSPESEKDRSKGSHSTETSAESSKKSVPVPGRRFSLVKTLDAVPILEKLDEEDSAVLSASTSSNPFMENMFNLLNDDVQDTPQKMSASPPSIEPYRPNGQAAGDSIMQEPSSSSSPRKSPPKPKRSSPDGMLKMPDSAYTTPPADLDNQSRSASVESNDRSSKSHSPNGSPPKSVSSGGLTPPLHSGNSVGSGSYYSGVLARAAAIKSSGTSEVSANIAPTTLRSSLSGSSLEQKGFKSDAILETPAKGDERRYNASISSSSVSLSFLSAVREDQQLGRHSSQYPAEGKERKHNSSVSSSSVSLSFLSPVKEDAGSQHPSKGKERKHISSMSSSSASQSFLSPVKSDQQLETRASESLWKGEEREKNVSVLSSLSLSSPVRAAKQLETYGTQATSEGEEMKTNVCVSSSSSSSARASKEMEIVKQESLRSQSLVDEDERPPSFQRTDDNWHTENTEPTPGDARGNKYSNNDDDSMSSMSSVASKARNSFFLVKNVKGSLLENTREDNDNVAGDHVESVLLEENISDVQHYEDSQNKDSEKSSVEKEDRHQSISNISDRARQLISEYSNRWGSDADVAGESVASNESSDKGSRHLTAPDDQSKSSSTKSRKDGHFDSLEEQSKISSSESEKNESFGGENLYEGFPSQQADDERIKLNRQSLSQNISATVETDPRKPWNTAPKNSSSDSSQDRLMSSYLDGNDGMMIDSEQKISNNIASGESFDSSDSSTLSELLDSKEALANIGLHDAESVTKENFQEDINNLVTENELPTVTIDVDTPATPATQMHVSRSSNGSSSSDSSECSTFSEILDSQEALTDMGLYKAESDTKENIQDDDEDLALEDDHEKLPSIATDLNTAANRKHVSHSSNGSSSSSITEWDFTGRAAPAEKPPSIADTSESSKHSKSSVSLKSEESHDAQSKSSNSTGAKESTKDPNKSSVRMLANAARQMTALLQQSLSSRSLKSKVKESWVNDEQSVSSKSHSVVKDEDESVEELDSLLKPSKIKSAVSENSEPSFPCKDEDSNDQDSQQEKDSNKTPEDALSSDSESAGSHEKINSLLMSFRKRKPQPKKSESFSGSDEEGSSDKANQRLAFNSSRTEEDSSSDVQNIVFEGSPAESTLTPRDSRKSDSSSASGPSSRDETEAFLSGYGQAALGVSSGNSDDESNDSELPITKSTKSSMKPNPFLDQDEETGLPNKDSDDKSNDSETPIIIRTKVPVKPNPFLDESDMMGLPAKVDNSSSEDADKDKETGNKKDEKAKAEESDTDAIAKRRCSLQEKFWKSKYFWIAILIIVLVLIGGIVGGIVGTNNKEKPPLVSPSLQPSNGEFTPPTHRPTSSPTTKATLKNWVQVGGDLVGELNGDEAGFSVSVSENGSRIIFGARRNAKDGMKNRGSARIFEFDNLTGFYVPVWDIYGEVAGDQCGFSVSISKNGKRVAVGSLGNDKNGQNSGQVRIFDENEVSGTWTIVSEFLGETEGSLFGSSVSLSQDGFSIAVGAPYYSTEGTDMVRSGRAYVYKEISESKWNPIDEPIDGDSSNSLFGWSVSLSPDGKFLAVGAPRLEGSEESGYVKVMYLEKKKWNLSGEPLSNGVPGDRFGFSVYIAGNNRVNRLAIGAPGFSANGEGSGFACIYENDGSGWLHLGHDLIGEGWGENLGYAVSMTPDGSRMIVGVPNKKLNGLPVGQIQVIDIESGTLVPAGEMYGRDGEKFGVSVGISYFGRLIFGGATVANLVRVYG